MIKKMKANNMSGLLKTLSEAVSSSDKAKGSKHKIFEPSFHCKECLTSSFLSQKLNYIHDNPTAKKWNLTKSARDYYYSSASYYYTGIDGPVRVTHFHDFFNTVLG
jgi:hypothetical protein